MTPGGVLLVVLLVVHREAGKREGDSVAAIVVDEGERYLLKLLMKDTAAAPPFILGLFVNDLFPDPSNTLLNVTEATFGGYLPRIMTRSVWTTPGTFGGVAGCTYGDEFQLYTCPSGSQLLHGWYIRDEDSNVLLWIERFSADFTIDSLHPLTLLPVVSLRSEYPIA